MKQLTLLLQKNCTLALPWASWCTFCMEELPVILPALNQRKTIHPVVLDLSRPFVQENFSKNFLGKLELSFTTYRIPQGSNEESYRRIIDPTWKGALPTAFLFLCKSNKCRLDRRWDRPITPKDLDDIVEVCRAS